MKISYIANLIIKLLLGQLINFRLSFASKINGNLNVVIKSLSILLLIAFSLPSNAQFVEKNNGLYGGHISSSAVSEDGLTLYVGLSNNNFRGIYKSTNAGATWSLTTSGVEGLDPTHMAISGSSIFSSSSFGLIRSVNNGISWQQIGPTADYINLIEAIGARIFVSAYTNSTATYALYVSSNNGDTWTEINNGLPTDGISSITEGSIFLFAGTNDRVYRSADNGASWILVGNGMPDFTFVTTLLYTGTELYAGSGYSGIYKSIDNGINWTTVLDGNAINPRRWVTSLNLVGASILASTDYGILISSDNGANWNSSDAGLYNTDVNTIEIAGSNIIAGTNGGVYISSDNGVNWSITNTGITNTDVKFLTKSGTDFYAGTRSGVFKSSDGAESWTLMSAGITNYNANAWLEAGSNLLVGTPDGVFLSSTSASNWSITQLSGIDITCLALKGTDIFAGSKLGVYLSNDNGVNWFGTSGGGLPINADYFDMKALAVNGSILFAATSEGVFRSTDNGGNWTSITAGLTTSQEISVLLVKDAKVFISIPGEGLFVSSDNGNTWTQKDFPNSWPTSLNSNGTDIFAGGARVYLSTDNGDTWTPSLSFSVNTVGPIVITEPNLLGGSNDKGVLSLPLSEFFTPTISSFTPTSGLEGDTIYISGAYLTDASSVSFGGTPASSFIVESDVSIAAFLGTGASGNVTVTTPSGTATLVGFTYSVSATISSFSPTTAGTGSTVIINGSKFTGATEVYFGGTAASSFTILDELTISAVVGSGSSGDISVVTPDGTATISGFNFVLSPTITSFTPPEASIGTEVIIEGANFSSVASENIVKFNGVTASVNDVIIDTIGYILDDSQVNSIINFVDFTASNTSDGLLFAGSEAFETSVEIRFGAGLSQKAHRFICFSCTYQDYVDVPFEVWDITNNRQLMVSFLDYQEDGTFNLLPYNTDGGAAIESREYINISSLTYNSVTPDPNIEIDIGQNYKDMYFFWPHLAEGATWDPANMASSNIIISYDPTITGKIYTNVPSGATTGPITVQVGTETATSNTNFTVLAKSFASLPYNPSDGGDFESNQSTWQVEHASGTSFELGSSSITGKNGTASGAFAWVTGINDATYIDNSASSLVSPSFNFSSTTEYKLGFKSKFIFEESYDGFHFEYSISDGEWIKLNNKIQLSWYNSSMDNSFPFFSGSTNSLFDSFETDLSFLVGNSDVRFKIVFLSDGSVDDIGMALDDFSITPAAIIKTFSFNSQLGETSVGGGIVNITVPSGTDVTTLVPNFTLTTGATATVNGNTQTSGNSALDFTNPVVYTITSNGASQDWVVTVTENNPFSYHKFTGNFLDETGAHNGIELTASNAFVNDRLGVNGAFRFNYQPTSTIEMGNTANVNLGDEITVMGWIRPDTYNSNGIELISNTISGNGFELRLSDEGIAAADLSYKRSLYSAITGMAWGASGEVLLDQWTHVAFRFKKGIGVTLFINGVYQGSLALAEGTENLSIPISVDPITLGRDFEGEMDEIKILPTALTDQEIYDHFNVNRWPFNSLAFRGPESGNAIDWELELNPAGSRYIEAIQITDPGLYAFRASSSTLDVFMGDSELDGIAEPGANQINVTTGFYAVDFEITNFEYSIVPITTIGIIGSAFPDGWNSDIDFTDLGNGVYEILNIAAIDGEWKIRVNDDWNINWGSTNNDGILNPNANNIGIAAGNYNITVDIVNKTYNVVITGDLVAHYTFNGDANDQSGNGFNGTVNGATLSQDRYGNTNSAYNFNSAGDVITASAPSNLSDMFSIAAWVQLATTYGASTGPVVEVLATGVEAFQFEINQSRHLYLVKTDDSQSETTVTGTQVLSTDTWHHIVLVNNGTTVTYYIDGQLDNETTNTGTIRTDGINMFMGGNGNTEYFDGDIDEVRIYSKALTTNEVFTMFDEERVPSSETEITIFSMSEQTNPASIGSSTIELTVGTSTNLTSLIATFNLSEGAIATVNGTEQFSGSSANNFSNTVTYVVTAADGTSTQNWDVTVSIGSGNTFVLTSNPSSIDASSGSTMSVNAVDNSIFNNISFAYRGISDGENANFSVRSTTNNGTIYSATLNGDEDLLGIEYKFIGDLTDGSSIETELSYLNITHSGDGLQIPGDRIKFSDIDALAYRAISIPLNVNNSSSNSIFAELGDYSTDWRMYSFNPSSSGSGGSFQEQSTSGASIQLGKGYFILAKSSASIFTGVGSTPSVTPTQPVEIQISQGWNLIGNPYNFSIDWQEVLAANTDVSNINQLSNQLKIWLGNYNNSNNHLLSFQGGFVFSSEAMSIKIPVTRNTSLPTNGGRMSEQSETDPHAWLATIDLKENETNISRMKVGMHENALPSYDKYDEVSLPSIESITSLKIAHPEFFVPSFSGDIVQVEDYFEWSIEMDKFKIGTDYKLNWKIEEGEQAGLSRILFDVTNQKIVNMEAVSHYSFRASKGQKFTLYYGDLTEINNRLKPSALSLGDVYPNPATEQLIIPISIPESQTVSKLDISIFNAQGKKLISLPRHECVAGFHQIYWDLRDSEGRKLPQGLYFITMKVGTTVQSKKVLIK